LRSLDDLLKVYSLSQNINEKREKLANYKDYIIMKNYL